MSDVEVVVLDTTVAMDGLEYMLSRLGMPRSDIEEVAIQVLDLMLDDYDYFDSNILALPDINRIVVVPDDMARLKLAVVTFGNTLKDLMKASGIYPVNDAHGVKSLPVSFNRFIGNDLVLNYLYNI